MILKKLSASAVDTADPNSAFGCPRKFHFQYVQGIRPPQDASAELGEAVHKSIEHYLAHKGDTGNALHPVALPAKEIIDSYLPRQKRIEFAFGPQNPAENGSILTSHGIPFSGRIDLLVSPLSTVNQPWRGEGPDCWEIVDWKTTSDIARFAKTRGEAAKSTQMLTYAEWFYRAANVDIGPLRGSFVYMQTRGRKSEKVSVLFDREMVSKGWTGVERLVKSCVDIAAEADVSKVDANLNACDVAKGCPYKGPMCPRNVTALQYLTQKRSTPTELDAPQKANEMSLLDRFRAAATTPAAPAPAGTQVGAAPVGNPQLEATSTAPPTPPAHAITPPPTAPERPSRKLLIGSPRVDEPAVLTEVAPPPAGVNARLEHVERAEEPRRAGRPKGSKNKVKAEDFKLPSENPIISEKPVQSYAAPEQTATFQAIMASSAAVAPASRITRAVIRKGCTIPTGNFANVRLDVELEMTGAIDLRELDRQVTEELERQSAQFQLNPNPPEKK